MKIKIEHELTYEEMREIYWKMKQMYLEEDIKSSVEGMEIELEESDIKKIAARVDKGLSNNDSYWESYWMTIENVIEEYQTEV